MFYLSLPEPYQIGMEKIPLNKVRVVLFNTGKEICCRKVNTKELRFFLNQKEESHLFKGRLQLHLNHQRIHLLAQKEIIATISIEAFQELLQKTTNQTDVAISKKCCRCNQTIWCNSASVKNCACSLLKLTAMQQSKASAYKDCLCNNCLTELQHD